MNTDPKRMLDDPEVSDALRFDLGHAGRAEVIGLDVSAGVARLHEAIAAEPAATGTGGMTASTKLIMGAAIIGGAVALWLAGRSDDAARPSDPAPATVIDEASPRNGAAAVDAPAEPTAQSQPSPIAPDEVLPAEAELRPTLDPPPGDPSARQQSEVAQPSEAESSAASARPRSATRPRSEPTSVSGVRREAKLVAKARRKLATDPAVALALTERLANEFPRGVLVEERQAIAIRALAKLGRTEEARRGAEKFLADHGDSPHAASVRRAID